MVSSLLLIALLAPDFPAQRGHRTGPLGEPLIDRIARTSETHQVHLKPSWSDPLDGGSPRSTWSPGSVGVDTSRSDWLLTGSNETTTDPLLGTPWTKADSMELDPRHQWGGWVMREAPEDLFFGRSTYELYSRFGPRSGVTVRIGGCDN